MKPLTSITSSELKKKYIEFFKARGHKEIANVSIIPENDPTVLFTPAGMHPLIPFLLGQKHPLGKRLVNVQRCLRTQDISEVGNAMHLSFFEMLGNWSLGDYWKPDAIKWSYEFLTKILKIPKEKIYVTCFKGDKEKNIPKDEETAKIWLSVGIPKERIYFLREDNWWGPAGNTGPCGPDTEMFIDTGKEPCGKDCRPGCKCGKYFEIWNDVFMQYNKIVKEEKEITEKEFKKLKEKGVGIEVEEILDKGKEKSYKVISYQFSPLIQKNVDTGMGVERTVAILQGKESVYEIETLKPIMDKVKELSGIKKQDKKLNEKQIRSMRIITDHIRASVFILGDENPVVPSNIDRGYILRRFIRRAVRHGRLLGITNLANNFTQEIAGVVIDINKQDYPLLSEKKDFIFNELKKEEEKFKRTLEKGLNKFNKIAEGKKFISGADAFLLFQSFGFPIEMTKELAQENGIKVDEKAFYEKYKEHQEISRKGAEKKFKGGLSDASYETTKLHTAAHLLLYALRQVLNPNIMQKGSNITPERIRFDFNFDRKLTDEEIKKVEDIVNNLIQKGIEVKRKEMPLEEAKKIAKSPFTYKTNIVSVYFIGPSIEICMGPHVKNTKELGHFKIIKQESAASGIRRVKAVLE